MGSRGFNTFVAAPSSNIVFAPYDTETKIKLEDVVPPTLVVLSTEDCLGLLKGREISRGQFKIAYYRSENGELAQYFPSAITEHISHHLVWQAFSGSSPTTLRLTSDRIWMTASDLNRIAPTPLAKHRASQLSFTLPNTALHKTKLNESSLQGNRTKDPANAKKKTPVDVQRQGVVDTARKQESSAMISQKFVDGKTKSPARTKMTACIDDFAEKTPGSAKEVRDKFISYLGDEATRPKFVSRIILDERGIKRTRCELVVFWRNERGAESHTGQRAITARIKKCCKARETT